jgi:hypothetical protein
MVIFYEVTDIDNMTKKDMRISNPYRYSDYNGLRGGKYL